jgi:uncharacterized protein with FMN-binding domain
MLSKRFALIVGGTLGGLGAVVSITPPQFGTSGGLTGGLSGGSLSGGSGAGTTTAPATTPATTTPVPATTTPAPTATTSTKKSKKKTTLKSSPGNSSANATAQGSTAATTAPAPAATQAAKPAAASGTFTGDAAQTRFGPVQVSITISNGRITNVTAPVYPRESFQDQQINAQAIPWLEQQTIAAQSANIQGVGGASYTSQGFYQSLVSALSKAGI